MPRRDDRRIRLRRTRHLVTGGILALIWGVHSTLMALGEDSPVGAPIPPAPRQVEIRKLLDETFELSKANTSTKKQQAAQQLMEMARNPATSPDELYVVLVTTLPLLRERGDFATYWEAVEKLTETFQLDVDVERTRLVTEYMTGCKSGTTLEPALKEVLEIASQAASLNRYRAATELLDTGDRQAKRVGAAKLSKVVIEMRIAVREREQAFQAQTEARKVLQANPEDPKANLTVGQWLAIYESDWNEAIAKLALAGDAKWKSAAVEEQKSSHDPESQLARADAWWEVAQSTTGDAKLTAQRRAALWYNEYEPNAKSPLVKARVAKRIEELAPSQEASSQTMASAKRSETGKSSRGKRLPTGKWIDLIKVVNLPEHSMRGIWQKQNGELVSVGTSHDLVMFPVAIRGGYELTCEFTNQTTADGIKVLLPVGVTSCGVTLNAGTISGLEAIDGIGVATQEPSSGAIVRQSVPAANQRHRLQIEMTLEAENVAIEARLDNQRVTSWKGKSTQLSQATAHVIPSPQAIGLMKWVTPMTIHKFEIRIKPGAEAYLLENDWKNPVTEAASAPPKEVAARCLNWKGRYYLISDKPLAYTDAHAMAVRLQGRLLTISSADEEAFILANGGRRNLWTAAWRRAESQEWRDERNRPLRYVGKWGPGQPSAREREFHVVFRTEKSGPVGWYDEIPWEGGVFACIEWGEEYSTRK